MLPVRRMTMIPRVNSARPKDLEKYSSTAAFYELWQRASFTAWYLRVGSRTSGERSVIMMVGETIKGKLCRASHPADP